MENLHPDSIVIGGELTNPHDLYIDILKRGRTVIRTARDGNSIYIWLNDPGMRFRIFPKLLMESIDIKITTEYIDAPGHI